MSKFVDWYIDAPENDLVLYIMRGLPGSGKSYTASSLGVAPENIFSADHFFGKVKEEYIANFDHTKLFLAHKICKQNLVKAMQRQITPLAVDNTNVSVGEVYPFLEFCLQFGYRAEIKEPTSDWWVEKIAPYLKDKHKYAVELEAAAQILFEKNEHGVPLDTLKKMIGRWHNDISARNMMQSLLKKQQATIEEL